MIASHRQWFNRNFTPAMHARFLELLEQECGEPVQFRHSETPCFLPASLVEKLARYGREIVEQIAGNAAYLKEAREAIPEPFRTPNEAPRPLFVQADFGLDQDLEPQLVEIQGFPSLYSYQPLIARSYREAHGIPDELKAYPGSLDGDTYHRLLREAIVGKCDAENVILMEIDPARQKTRHDFVMTERLFGVRTVDVSEIRKDGRRVYYEHEGRRIPIHRIYNRVIVDELVRRNVPMSFDFRDDLDVEWAGHPNWFFLLSKFSLPYLDHVSVPKTRFLEDPAQVTDPTGCVLKPLFSFAGSGVIVGPTREQIAAVFAEGRRDYIIQRRVDFRPVLETPFGPTKMEIRVMYLWLDKMHAVNTIIRMGRGSQMGVDHNKGMEWVGGSAAFIDPSQ